MIMKFLYKDLEDRCFLRLQVGAQVGQRSNLEHLRFVDGFDRSDEKNNGRKEPFL